MVNSICPVPLDQQPLYEYQSLKKIALFSWPLMKVKYFILSIICTILAINFCSILITFQYSIVIKPRYLFYIYNFIFSTLIIEFMFIRIYLGWSYISKRLLSASVIYEEFGWYDVQIWVKSTKSLIQDRLVCIYEVIPLLRLVKTSIIIIFSIVCVVTIFLIAIR